MTVSVSFDTGLHSLSAFSALYYQSLYSLVTVVTVAALDFQNNAFCLLFSRLTVNYAGHLVKQLSLTAGKICTVPRDALATCCATRFCCSLVHVISE